jgi:hypothetical protein
MGSSNYERRRFYRTRTDGPRERTRCASCGARASHHAADLRFCITCLEWARQANLDVWDDLGAGD